jgi:hypothetical protein
MTDLIDGGVPAGIIMIPEDCGCRTKRISIMIMTRHGKRRTMPRGIETDEFPLSRIRRRKKANRGDIFSARRERSSSVSKLVWGVGILLTMFCTSPIFPAGDHASPGPDVKSSPLLIPMPKRRPRGACYDARFGRKGTRFRDLRGWSAVDKLGMSDGADCFERKANNKG